MTTMKIFSSLFRYIIISLLLTAGISHAQFGKNKVQYNDIDMFTFSTTHYIIYYQQGDEFLAEYTALESERFYQVFKRYLQYELEEKVPIIIYSSPNDFLQTNVISGQLGEGVQGFTEAFKSRVVLPFNGSYNDYRHTLHHELTHAIFHYFLFGGKIQNIVNTRRLIDLPLWFEEGLPEFVTTYWDTEADMVMRDAEIYGYLPPMEYLNGYFAYKGGQSVYQFINEKYGEEKIGELLRSVKSAASINHVFKKVFGLEMEEFSKQWSKWIKTCYWEELSKREEAPDMAKAFTDHTKDKSYFNIMPSFSPNGEYLAFFSDRSDYTGLFIRSTINKKKQWCLLKSGQKGNLESFHLFETKLAWSNDGKYLVFVNKEKNRDRITLYEVEKRQIVKSIDPGLNGVSSPSFAPGDSIILFTGFENSRQNLYLYTLSTGELQAITHDFHTKKDPVFSPDGHRIAFASDRPFKRDLKSESEAYQKNLGYNQQNIFVLDINSREIIPVTTDSSLNEYPEWSPDGRFLAYVSDRNGISNIYLWDSHDSQSRPITNILSCCKHITWSKRSDKIAFTSFIQGGWDIFVLNNPISRLSKYSSLHPTRFRESDPLGKFYQRYLSLPYGTTLSHSLTGKIRSKEMIYKYQNTDYVVSHTTHKASQPDSLKKSIPDSAGGSMDSTIIPTPFSSDQYVKKIQSDIKESLPYQIKFSPDLVTGSFYYDTYYGMGGQAVFAFSDVMGNHQIVVYSDLYYSFENSNILVNYYFLPKKWDLGLSFYQLKNDYQLTYYDILSMKQIGFQGFLYYPFNTYSRAELGLNSFSINAKKYLYNSYYDYIYLNEEEKLRVSLLQARYVYDNVLYGDTGPSNGWRYYIDFEKAVPVSDQDLNFERITFDFRKYFNFQREYTLAVRLTGGKSFGEDPQYYYIGGTPNWLNYSRKEYGSWEMKSSYMASLCMPMRGFSLYERVGTTAAMMNLEFRFRFIDYLIFNFPARFGFMSITGVVFNDWGAAWNDWNEFRLWSNQKLTTPIASYGYGIRINLGIALLKIDIAYPTDLRSFRSKPHVLYSFGIDF
ncbi:MAG: PD40 domain-containing protein [Candidatus Delongbacteria bacterium]|nr:PD40 domain-containing protein [Candidatus Delongbacteria bacterium]